VAIRALSIRMETAETKLAVSVVVSVHNGGAHLHDCLASLARHRDQFAELLVVDDGSTDDAIDSAKDFGARVLRVGSRRGPANGRNVGAFAATGDILLFLDADVCVHDDAIPRIRERFENEPALGALFGSYDSEPSAPQLVSQFRNLLHFFVHQTSNRRACTFWSGCGAIRRDIFLNSKGFDLSYSSACIEDIELGTRLARHGVHIALDPSIQVKHLKRWTLWSMVLTDIRQRGICWTQLILSSRQMPNDLNLRFTSRISVAMTSLFCALSVLLAVRVLAGKADTLPWWQAALWPAFFGAILALNLPFYRFLSARRGTWFAAAAVPLHLIYFFCCGTALILGMAFHWRSQLALKFGRGEWAPDQANAEVVTGLAGRMPPTGIPVPDANLVKIIESGLLAYLPQCRPDNARVAPRERVANARASEKLISRRIRQGEAVKTDMGQRIRAPAGCLNDALHYALFPGGKRLRPLLTILAARIFSAQDERVVKAACAVELVHASSLIIDDLPCMDDADIRRGRQALHRVYGEEVALLAGIALLNQAYALFSETPELIREAVECIGVDGMIGGQAIDLCADPRGVSLAERDRKTSALMRLALTAGALAAGASRQDVAPLAAAGQQLGQAYQICDDLLDAGLADDSSGKTIGQDLRHHRPSHGARLDADARRAEAVGLVDQVRRSLLDHFGPSIEVSGLTNFIDNNIFAPLSRALQQAGVAAASR
jgi:geranylgeranyl pyrophosphate synthase/GT2 family glycosyltransferase